MVGENVDGENLIRGARQVITMRGSSGPRQGMALRDLGILSNGSVLVRNGLIDEVGPTSRISNLEKVREALEINAAGRVVMPGLIDGHTHLTCPVRARSAHGDENPGPADCDDSVQRLRLRTQTWLKSMARHGTTTVEAKSGWGPAGGAGTKMLRVLDSLQNDPIDIVPTFLYHLPRGNRTQGADDVADSEIAVQDVLVKVRRRQLANFADLTWDPEPDRQAACARYLEGARRLGFACKIHIEEGGPAVAMAMAVRHFAVSVDHLENSTRNDAALLAGSGTIATLLPYASLQDGGSNELGRSLVDAGVAIALGTNFSPGNSPMLSMQTAIALACNRLGLEPAEAISAATINAAHALGCARKVGSLDRDKSADLVILNISDYRELAHHIGTNLVHMTIKGGHIIYREGNVVPHPANAPVPSVR